MRESISLLETVMFGIAGGGDINDKAVLQAYVQNSEIDLDKAAAHLVVKMLLGDYKDAVSIMRQSNNARGLLNKILWLLDFIIGSQTGTAKFTPYVGKLFIEQKKASGAKASFITVMNMFNLFVAVNVDFNRTNVNEMYLLQSVVAKYQNEFAEEEE
jgi:hypothetical protein